MRKSKNLVNEVQRHGYSNGGIINPLDGVGEYWSNSNAQFEARNPNLLQRGLRAINPITGLGSAVGNMHDAASAGSVRDMAIAAAQAMPLFAARTLVPGIKTAAGMTLPTTAASTAKTATAAGGGAVLGGAVDELQARGYANGGMVRGKGTGTSDSIHKTVPEGTYIMPADSTKAIGARGLAGLGKKVPVALSNGEYELPPEQVHAVGVQTLDQIKNATHTPIARGLPGYTQQNQEPRQFFASGGAVDDMSRWKAASDALRQSNDRIAASQGRVNMQAPDGRFDEAKLEQAANMVQQSRLRMGTQAPVSNPNGSMNMQRVAALSNMVADSRARGLDPEAARQYRENKAIAMASNAPNRPRGLPGYQPRQYLASGGSVKRLHLADAGVVTQKRLEEEGRIRWTGNPNTGGASNMSNEARAFMKQQAGQTASPAQGQGAAYRAGQSLGKVSQNAAGAMDYATGGKEGALKKTGSALGRALGLYQVGDDVKANFDAYKNMVESGTATPSDYAAGGVEMIGNTVGSGVLNLGKKFPVVGPMLASTANAAFGPNASGRVATGFADAMDNAGVLSRYGLGAAENEGTATGAPPAAVTNTAPATAPPAAAAVPASDVVAPNADGNTDGAGSTGANLPPPTNARQVGNTGAYEHARGQYSDNPAGMGFNTGFTGQPTAQNNAAMQNIADRYSSQISGMAAQQMQQPQVRGFDVPQIAHSGNSWEARNNLRNLQVGMNSMRSTNASRAAGLAAYKSALDADARARGAENEAGITAMRENAAIARTGMSEAGANQRAADNNALEAQRIGIAGQEAVFNRGVKGFDIQNAQRKQYIQSLMDAATTPEERKAIAERFPDVYGRDSKTKMQFDVIRGKNDPITGAYSGDYAVAFDPETGTIQRMDIGGASQPDIPIPQAASERVVGTIYTAPNGQKVKWDGKGFLPV